MSLLGGIVHSKLKTITYLYDDMSMTLPGENLRLENHLMIYESQYEDVL